MVLTLILYYYIIIIILLLLLYIIIYYYIILLMDDADTLLGGVSNVISVAFRAFYRHLSFQSRML